MSTETLEQMYANLQQALYEQQIAITYLLAWYAGIKDLNERMQRIAATRNTGRKIDQGT